MALKRQTFSIIQNRAQPTIPTANAPLYTKLASAANVVGEFAAGQVSFVYDETDATMRAMFSLAEIVYERDGEKGLWLKTTPRGTTIIFR